MALRAVMIVPSFHPFPLVANHHSQLSGSSRMSRSADLLLCQFLKGLNINLLAFLTLPMRNNSSLHIRKLFTTRYTMMKFHYVSDQFVIEIFSCDCWQLFP